MNPLSEALAARLDELLPNLVEIYKDFHRNPELSMQEFRTAKIVADYLEDCGYSVQRGIGDTGVIGPWPYGPVWMPSPSKRPPGPTTAS